MVIGLLGVSCQRTRLPGRQPQPERGRKMVRVRVIMLVRRHIKQSREPAFPVLFVKSVTSIPHNVTCAISGCWVLGVGCWVLGVGCWVLGVGCWQDKSSLTLCQPLHHLSPITYHPSPITHHLTKKRAPFPTLLKIILTSRTAATHRPSSPHFELNQPL